MRDVRGFGPPEGDAKWAAIVDDRLIPLPRRKIATTVILQQAGLMSNATLVRDYNSPNDIGYEPEVLIDLAEGNVFRSSNDCVRGREIEAASAPKLAFVVDDKWEISIQSEQTGQSLRGLFGLLPSVILQRDHESPNDELIEIQSQVRFVDGPVFITREIKPNEITIVVEGTPYQWFKPTISYVEVVTLFDPQFPQHPEITYSVTYKKGPNNKPEGILTPGASIKVKDRMVFNVSPTGQS